MTLARTGNEIAENFQLNNYYSVPPITIIYYYRLVKSHSGQPYRIEIGIEDRARARAHVGVSVNVLNSAGDPNRTR